MDSKKFAKNNDIIKESKSISEEIDNPKIVLPSDYMLLTSSKLKIHVKDERDK